MMVIVTTYMMAIVTTYMTAIVYEPPVLNSLHLISLHSWPAPAPRHYHFYQCSDSPPPRSPPLQGPPHSMCSRHAMMRNLGKC